MSEALLAALRTWLESKAKLDAAREQLDHWTAKIAEETKVVSAAEKTLRQSVSGGPNTRKFYSIDGKTVEVTAGLVNLLRVDILSMQAGSDKVKAAEVKPKP